MLPAATLPAARYYVTPARQRVCVRGLPGPRREARRREEPARDAAAGLAEVMAMPAIWKDAAGNLLELPGPGGGIVACGALPGAAAPVPAWTAGELAAAGVPAEPGPVRDGTGLGLVSCVTGPALIDEALAGTPVRVRPLLSDGVRPDVTAGMGGVCALSCWSCPAVGGWWPAGLGVRLPR